MYEVSDVRPTGHPEAVVWKGGHHTGEINPVAHSLTDAYALLGTIAAIDVLGLPFYAVPMWAQFRHDTKLKALSWFGNMPCMSIKWSTAGDAYVRNSRGEKVVVMGNQVMRRCVPKPVFTVTFVRMDQLRLSDVCRAFRILKINPNLASVIKPALCIQR